MNVESLKKSCELSALSGLFNRPWAYSIDRVAITVQYTDEYYPRRQRHSLELE